MRLVSNSNRAVSFAFGANSNFDWWDTSAAAAGADNIFGVSRRGLFSGARMQSGFSVGYVLDISR